MPLTLIAAVAVVGYLLGSIPFGYLLVRFVRKEDIRAVGSGNIGATNVLRSGSKGLGAWTLLLDTAKGVLAVFAGHWIAQLFGITSAAEIRNAAAIAGLAALLGHVFPVWLKFKGGKGVATGFGVFLALVPAAAGLCVCWCSRLCSDCRGLCRSPRLLLRLRFRCSRCGCIAKITPRFFCLFCLLRRP